MKKNLGKIKQEIQWLIKDKYAGEQNQKFFNDLKRLKNNEPLDYIIGWKPFLNCQIDLSQKPFIPRPETEHWTEKFIAFTKTRGGRIKILDAFAGSGCVGIAILKNLKNTNVDFIEKNPEFIKQIKINLKLNKIASSRYQIIHSNIFENVGMNKKYDFILANPPYVPLKNKKLISASVLKHEPLSAIFGGKDGLFYIKKFLEQAKNHLKPNGEIWLEFDSSQKNAIKKLIQKKYQLCEFERDQYGQWRYAKIKNLFA